MATGLQARRKPGQRSLTVVGVEVNEILIGGLDVEHITNEAIKPKADEGSLYKWEDHEYLAAKLLYSIVPGSGPFITASINTCGG